MIYIMYDKFDIIIFIRYFGKYYNNENSAINY